MPIKQLGYGFLVCLIYIQSIVVGITPITIYAAEPPELAEPEELAEPTSTEDPYLVISAVQITGGTGKTHEDFIELYNPTNQNFDLNGHRLVKRTAAGTSDVLLVAWTQTTIVPAYHFYLWAQNSFTLTTTADVTSSATIAADNGIALRFGNSNEGEIIDSLAWGSTANGFDNGDNANPGANESLILQDLFTTPSLYEIKASAPRNSFIEELPPLEPESEDNEETESELEPEAEPEDEPIKIIITEILPNPPGSDSGLEQVELYNQGIQTVNINNFKLDDVEGSEPLSSNAYIIPNIEIAPGEVLSVNIPSGAMSLNNTGGDNLSLFNSENNLIDSIFYELAAPEGKSLLLYDGAWYWGESSFGQLNIAPPQEEVVEDEETEEENEPGDDYDNSGLKITEVFPQPKTRGNEFIEIVNDGSSVAQLSQISIAIGDRKKTLPEHELEAGEYFVLDQADLPVQLRNSGQVVKLYESGMVLDTVTYPAAIVDASFAKFEDGFLWTTQITKSKDNILEIPKVIKAVVNEKAKATTKVAAAKPSTVKAASTRKTTQSPAKSPTAPIKTTAPAPQATPADTSEPKEMISAAKPSLDKSSLGKIIAMGAAAVTAGIIALYKLVFTGSTD